MRRKNEVEQQLKLFDSYGEVLNYDLIRGTEAGDSAVVNFLSQLRDQRTLTQDLLTKIKSYGNLDKSIRQVSRNQGSSGVDGREIEETKEWLRTHFTKLRTWVLSGCYEVREVLLVEIDKPDGGVRELGIPTVLDRIVQQAIHQQLSPLYDRHFSDFQQDNFASL